VIGALGVTILSRLFGVTVDARFLFFGFLIGPELLLDSELAFLLLLLADLLAFGLCVSLSLGMLSVKHEFRGVHVSGCIGEELAVVLGKGFVREENLGVATEGIVLVDFFQE
jgi:hypothetical protein